MSGVDRQLLLNPCLFLGRASRASGWASSGPLNNGVGGPHVLSGSARTNARRDILRLPAAEAYLLYGVEAAWAAASTSRKNLARAEASPA